MTKDQISGWRATEGAGRVVAAGATALDLRRRKGGGGGEKASKNMALELGASTAKASETSEGARRTPAEEGGAREGREGGREREEEGKGGRLGEQADW